MGKKITQLYDAYAGNVYRGMLDDLSAHLGVSREALERLRLGWAPIVEFKNGKNYQGWWVIPERDEDGQVVGLSLRSLDDNKVMLPGSKHGLIYSLNPDHELGSPAYNPGPHNWLRTAAHRPCPVCDKPDGCLIQIDDPASPSAVICIRHKSPRPMKLGYLHRLKDAGGGASSPLPPSDRPVLVVEGMTDVAAAYDMGFEAVGRPSNLAGMDTLKSLLRGRNVIVVGENDKKLDGREPGREGMVAAFQTLRKVCRNLSKVMPPADAKDLRQWRTRYGLTADQFLTYVKEYGSEQQDDVVIEDARPLTVAHRFLMDTYRAAGRWTLRYFKGGWFEFTGSKYREIELDRVRNRLYLWAHDKYVATTKPNGEETVEQIKANRHWVTDIEDAMRSIVAVDAEDAPAWLDGRADKQQLISFANGLLDVDRYLAGRDDYMSEPTPDYFCLVSLPFAFDPTAKCRVWKRFLFDSLGDEAGKVKLLKQYLGYIVSSDTSYQKFLVLRGVPASGKGTIINTVEQLVGKEQFTETTLASLGDKYGLENLMGTMVATMTEMKTARSAVNQQSIETILKIVGEDPVSINRKYKPIIRNHRLDTRFLMATNELPYFPDHSHAMKRRMMVLEFTRSFVGREDRQLKRKLRDELSGICVWALEGLRDLHAAGDFALPKSSLEAIESWKMDASPITAFIEDCVEFQENGCIVEKEAYHAYRAWSEERGTATMTAPRFRSLFVDSTPSSVFRAKRQDTRTGRKLAVFENCVFTKWVATEYLGEPRNG